MINRRNYSGRTRRRKPLSLPYFWDLDRLGHCFILNTAFQNSSAPPPAKRGVMYVESHRVPNAAATLRAAERRSKDPLPHQLHRHRFSKRSDITVLLLLMHVPLRTWGVHPHQILHRTRWRIKSDRLARWCSDCPVTWLCSCSDPLPLTVRLAYEWCGQNFDTWSSCPPTYTINFNQLSN